MLRNLRKLKTIASLIGLVVKLCCLLFLVVLSVYYSNLHIKQHKSIQNLPKDCNDSNGSNKLKKTIWDCAIASFVITTSRIIRYIICEFILPLYTPTIYIVLLQDVNIFVIVCSIIYTITDYRLIVCRCFSNKSKNLTSPNQTNNQTSSNEIFLV